MKQQRKEFDGQADTMVETRDEEKEKLRDMCRVLFNRCRASMVIMDARSMCGICGMRDDCDRMHSI